MTRFIDGPAAGVSLELRAAPALLRAVRTPEGIWDALDQPEDVAGLTEEIFVYRRVGSVRSAMIDYYDRGRRRGKALATADYRLFDPQPPDSDVRSNEAWIRWVRAKLLSES